MLEHLLKAYNEAVYDTDRQRALRLVHEAVEHGVSPEDIVFKVVSPCLDAMIKAVTEGNSANLAQHFMASQIAAAVTDEMTAKFRKAPSSAGVVVIGNSQGDFHDLGKRIVIGCLKARLIEVTDLGLNVSPERFVEEAEDRNAHVIAISSMMVHTACSEHACPGVRQLLKKRGLESRTKVIVGGAPYRFNPDLYRVVQADAWAENGIAAGEVVARLIDEVKS